VLLYSYSRCMVISGDFSNQKFKSVLPNSSFVKLGLQLHNAGQTVIINHRRTYSLWWSRLVNWKYFGRKRRRYHRLKSVYLLPSFFKQIP
jgi:hypothetical protein